MPNDLITFEKMRIKKSNIENIIYMAIWLFVYVMAIFFSTGKAGTNWSRVFNEWFRFSFFFAIFILNNAIFTPKFLFNKKYAWYFILVVISAILVSYINVNSKIIHDLINSNFQNFQRHPLPEDPLVLGRRPMSAIHVKPEGIALFENILISFLIVGLNTAIKVASKWQTEEKLRVELQNKHLEAELSLLRHQVSPHFFMNTLNNIHSLIDIDKANAQDAIIRLSKLMRYLLYESEQKETLLEKEVNFLKSFIELMQIRYDEKVSIIAEFPDHFDSLKIAPLVFISFVENCFKHGISYQHDSFIHIKITTEGTSINFEAVNTKHKQANKEIGGIGIQNIKKRLEILYPDKHQLEIIEDDNLYSVKLSIETNGN